MTDEPKIPPSEAPRAGHDPDATLVVDGQRVWDALKAVAPSGHSPAAAPAAATTESLDDDWDLGPASTKPREPPAAASPPESPPEAAPAEAPPSAETAPLAVTAPPPADAAPSLASADSGPFLDSDLLVDEEPAAPSQSKIITARPPPGDTPATEASLSDPVPAAFARPTPVGFAAIVPNEGPVEEIPAAHSAPATTAPAAPEPKAPRGPSAVEMEDQFAIGDFAGAIAIAEALLARDPEHVDALECLERSRGALRASLATKLGPLDRVPVVAVARDQLRWLAIDHKAGFILSHVDGVSSVEEIVDISGMKELEALGILAELLEQRIIDFAARR